jgi:hypothetical protein
MEPDVATCGRHVVTRLLLRNMPLNDYANVVFSGNDPDEFVTLFTEALLELNK